MPGYRANEPISSSPHLDRHLHPEGGCAHCLGVIPLFFSGLRPGRLVLALALSSTNYILYIVHYGDQQQSHARLFGSAETRKSTLESLARSTVSHRLRPQ